VHCVRAPLFLQELELIHSKQDTLQFRAFIQVLEVHDFSIPGVDISEDSSSETTHGLTRVEARVCTDPGIGFSIMSLASRHPGKLGLPYC
jgi:hypothetical protein